MCGPAREAMLSGEEMISQVSRLRPNSVHHTDAPGQPANLQRTGAAYMACSWGPSIGAGFVRHTARASGVLLGHMPVMIHGRGGA